MQFLVKFFGSFWSLSSLVPHMLIISYIAFTFRINDGTSNLVICLFLSYAFSFILFLSFWAFGLEASLEMSCLCEWEYAAFSLPNCLRSMSENMLNEKNVRLEL